MVKRIKKKRTRAQKQALRQAQALTQQVHAVEQMQRQGRQRRAARDVLFKQGGSEGVAKIEGRPHPFSVVLESAVNSSAQTNADLAYFDGHDVEALLADLKGAELTLDRVQFEKEAVDHTSAWACARACYGDGWKALSPTQQDVLGIVGVMLWHHWIQERPCVESAGLYLRAYFEAGAYVPGEHGCATQEDFLAATSRIMDVLLPPSGATSRTIDRFVCLWSPAVNLITDLGEMALSGTKAEAQYYAAFLASILPRLDLQWEGYGEPLDADLCRLHIRAGEWGKADALAREIRAAHPTRSVGYALYLDLYETSDDLEVLSAVIAELDAVMSTLADPKDWGMRSRIDELRARRAVLSKR